MKREPERRRTLGWLTTWWHHSLTPAGRVLMALLLVCLPSLTSFDSGLLPLFSAAASLLLVVAVVGSIYRPALRVDAAMPERVMCASSCCLSLTVTNLRNRLSAVSALVWHDIPASWRDFSSELPLEQLGPRASRTISLKFHPERRGVYACPRPEAVSTFPWALFRFRQRRLPNGCPSTELCVYPRFQPLAQLPVDLASLGWQDPCRSIASRCGDSTEIWGNREYQPGMVVRQWDFASWARLGRPIVREYTATRDTRLLISVDCVVDSFEALGDSRQFEQRLSRVASICDVLLRERIEITWLILGSTVVSLRSDSLQRQYDRLWDALARAQPMRPDEPLPTSRLPTALLSESDTVLEFVGTRPPTAKSDMNRWGVGANRHQISDADLARWVRGVGPGESADAREVRPDVAS